MFQSTLPLGAPDLMRVSAFHRYLGESVGHSEGDGEHGSQLSSLNPSLMQDLKRFEQSRGPGAGIELLEVMAACVRHASKLVVHLQDGERVVPLTVFPVERLVHCPFSIEQFLATPLNELQVLRVEPAMLDAPRGEGIPALHSPLSRLLWELALRGSRDALLPEISGVAAYRIAAGVNLRGLALTGTLAQAVDRLQQQTSNLRSIAEWPGFDRERAMRLLNALYLQAGLIISRTHPAATNDRWFGGR